MSDVVVAREECLTLFGFARCRDVRGASRARPNTSTTTHSTLSFPLTCLSAADSLRQ